MLKFYLRSKYCIICIGIFQKIIFYEGFFVRENRVPFFYSKQGEGLLKEQS